MPIDTPRANPVCALALLSLTIAALAAPGELHAEDRYVAPSGLGSRNGLTSADAAPFSRLDEQIAAAGAGGRVFLRTDLGPYSSRYHEISHGGAYGAPVTLSGIDAAGAGSTVRVVGNGKPYFQLLDGADHLRFVGWSFTNTGEGAFRIRGAIAGLTLENVDGTDLRQLVEMNEGSSLTGFRFSRLTSSGFSKAFLGLKNASHGIIENSDLDSNWRDGDPIPEGIHIQGDSYDIVIRDVSIRNIVYSRFNNPNRYWNGDGIATERETRGIHIVRVRVDGASDAGFDLKGGTRGDPHIIYDSTASNVKRGLRVWGTTIASDLDIRKLTLPSVTLSDGTVVTQTEQAGPVMAIQLLSGATLFHRNVRLDGRPIAWHQVERAEDARLLPLRGPRPKKAFKKVLKKSSK